MDAKIALNFVETIVYEKTGKYLTDLERDVFLGAWNGKTYEEIYPLNPEYVEKSVGYKLWRKLAQVLGNPVSKKTLRGAIERALRTQPAPLRHTLEWVLFSMCQVTRADRSTLWRLDWDSHTLSARILGNGGQWHDLCLPVGMGYVGWVAETGQLLNVPYDVYTDQLATVARQTDQSTGYRTCNLLCVPVWGADGKLLGVTQLLNKMASTAVTGKPCYDQQVPNAFQTQFEPQDELYIQVFNLQVGMLLQTTHLPLAHLSGCLV